MSWHVASRSSLSALGTAEPLAQPLDLEYAATKHQMSWWRPQQRLGQMAYPTATAVSPRALPPIISPTATPRYEPLRTGGSPTLREHIFTVRGFKQVSVPAGELIGSVPLAAMSNPKLAFERGLKIPRTPVYDGTTYSADVGIWQASTSVSGYFGPAH